MKQLLFIGLTMMLGVLGLNGGYGQYTPKATEMSTNRGYIVLKTAAKVDSAISVNTGSVVIYNQFFGGTGSFHINGEVVRNTGSPAGKCYFVVGDVFNKLIRIDSVNIFNQALTRFSFRLPPGYASFSFYGVEWVSTAGTQNTTLKATMQGKTTPEVKSN